MATVQRNERTGVQLRLTERDCSCMKTESHSNLIKKIMERNLTLIMLYEQKEIHTLVNARNTPANKLESFPKWLRILTQSACLLIANF